MNLGEFKSDQKYFLPNKSRNPEILKKNSHNSWKALQLMWT